MPTSSQMHLPKTKVESEFEDMCTDILSIHYGGNFKRFGRKGQGQNGIDIYEESNTSNCIVAQCKNYLGENSASNLIKNIKNDINASNNLSFNIKKFVIMTSMNRDEKVQSAIQKLNCNFSIEIWFWDEIEAVICSHKTLLLKYYSQIYSDKDSSIDIDALNKFLANLNTLKEHAEYININYKDYKVAENKSDDITVYNQCVTMINCCCSIVELRNKYCIQLKSLNALKNIEKIVESMPKFINAQNDWTDVNLVVTVDNYIKYFTCDDCFKKFIKKCNKLIKKLQV